MNSKINVLKVGNKKHHFTEADLPSLIHYKAKTWWSNYSMKLMANLALRWSKAVILTWYPEAKEQFYQDTKTLVEQTATVHTLDEAKENENKQIIIIHGNDEKLCLEVIKSLKDIDERVIFIKNIDIFNMPLFNECLQRSKLILSGNLDFCPAKQIILGKKFASILLFAQPEIDLPYTFVPGELYTWYIRSKNIKWYVKSSW